MSNNSHTAPTSPRTVYLAGGCFWGVEAYFQRLNGILSTEVGYANGLTNNTDYHSLHTTDHAETVRINFDDAVISLEEVLAHYFRIIDPLSLNRQGNDSGRQYRTGIFYSDATVQRRASVSLAQLQTHYSQPIAVTLEELRNFVSAEDYHQDYLAKNPSGYCHVNLALATQPLHLGPELKPIPTLDELRKTLSPLAFHVTQEEGTEAPRSSEFDQFNADGIFVDIVSGQALFSSRDKFDAGCGWPSFTRPILQQGVGYKQDFKLARPRTEVSSSFASSHLGHVFPDGPAERGGLRYCIDGAALRFIPRDRMNEEGYGDFLPFLEAYEQ